MGDMSTNGDPEGGPAREPDPDGSARGPDPDYRLLALAAIVPVIIIGAILVRIIVDRPHDSTTTQGSLLTVVVPAQAPSTGCGAADAPKLGAQGTAVEATVTEVSGRIVRLQPKRVFKGARYERIQIDLPPQAPPAALRLPTFTTGTTYLLAVAPDDTLSGCGLTGIETSSLRRLYTAAFG